MINEVKDKNKAKESALKKFFKPFSKKQLVAFVFGLILFLGGLSFLVTNLVGESLNVAPSRNPIILADSALKSALHTPLGFLYWGIILLILGGLILATSLSLASKNEDRDKERQERREQRLKQMLEASKEDAAIETTVVEAKSENK